MVYQKSHALVVVVKAGIVLENCGTYFSRSNVILYANNSTPMNILRNLYMYHQKISYRIYMPELQITHSS